MNDIKKTKNIFVLFSKIIILLFCLILGACMLLTILFELYVYAEYIYGDMTLPNILNPIINAKYEIFDAVTYILLIMMIFLPFIMFADFYIGKKATLKKGVFYLGAVILTVYNVFVLASGC